jgi:putative Mn2+ efflux pump MntP
MDLLSRAAFGITSVVLMVMAVVLVVYGVFDLVTALRGPWREAGDALLTAIGYQVIAMAVFDVAKYFMEEEVIRGRELRIASEARRSLTKFISTIAIAVFIEALVIVFQVSKQDVTKMLFPTALLVVAILIVVGLGVYQRLSIEVEQKVDNKDKNEQSRTKRG